MKKILILVACLSIFIMGCMDTMNTPVKRVEEFLGKYQTMDKEVLTQLDEILKSDSTLRDEDKDEYKALMEKQYQNLSYKIKNETTNGDSSVVDVEIEVFDYANAISKSDKYLTDHEEEFYKDDKTVDYNKFNKYKINNMKNTTDKAKYTITFELEQEDGKWKLHPVSDSDIEKIHGLYNN